MSTTGRETEAREDRIIDEFCEAVGHIEGIELKVVGRPDRDNPGAGGCDALVSRQGTTCAVEHTTFDAFPDQRSDSHRFRIVVSPLENSISTAFPDSFIRVAVPVQAVPTGLSWPELRDRLHERCAEAIEQMEAVPPWEDRYEVLEFGDVPFPVYISRQHWPEDPGCLVMRSTPDDQKAALQDCIRTAVVAKRGQLRSYHESGNPTILILASDERALINDVVVAEAFVTALADEGLPEIDDVFYAESKRRPAWFYPLKVGPRMYPDLPECEQYRSAQFRQRYPHARV